VGEIINYSQKNLSFFQLKEYPDYSGYISVTVDIKTKESDEGVR
jgi:hypothetical protein